LVDGLSTTCVSASSSSSSAMLAADSRRLAPRERPMLVSALERAFWISIHDGRPVRRQEPPSPPNPPQSFSRCPRAQASSSDDALCLPQLRAACGGEGEEEDGEGVSVCQWLCPSARQPPPRPVMLLLLLGGGVAEFAHAHTLPMPLCPPSAPPTTASTHLQLPHPPPPSVSCLVPLSVCLVMPSAPQAQRLGRARIPALREPKVTQSVAPRWATLASEAAGPASSSLFLKQVLFCSCTRWGAAPLLRLATTVASPPSRAPARLDGRRAPSRSAHRHCLRSRARWQGASPLGRQRAAQQAGQGARQRGVRVRRCDGKGSPATAANQG
jgi:hypothetical protein